MYNYDENVCYCGFSDLHAANANRVQLLAAAHSKQMKICSCIFAKKYFTVTSGRLFNAVFAYSLQMMELVLQL